MEPARKLDFLGEQEPLISLRPQRKKKHLRIPAPILVCLVAAMCVFGGLLYLDQDVITMHMHLRINQADEQIASLINEQNILVMELEQSKQLSRVETIARFELGMVEPASAEMLVMAPNNNESNIGDGWLVEAENEQNIFLIVADWLNQLLPAGGVEAGQIGY